jgi:RHS repeat-associated protein
MGTETGNSVERTLAIDESSIYGSSRLGTIKREQWMARTTYDLTTGTPVPVSYTTFIPDEHIKDLFRGDKNYELSNHLGNVLAVVSDRRTPEFSGGIFREYNANINSAQDYYSFGMTHPGRSFGSTTYKYGFNGKLKDDEWNGNTGATYDYGFRIYDSRIGKFLSVDPLSSKYPWYTPYQFAGNKPIVAGDIDGSEEWYYWNSFSGWKTSANISGPFSEDIMNKHGYYSASQVHKIEQNNVQSQKLAEENNKHIAARRWEQFNQWAENRPQNNPAFGALEAIHKLGPTGSAVSAYQDFSEGNIGWGITNTVATIFDVAAIARMTKVARASQIDQIWKMDNFSRGVNFENYLAKTRYSGFEHMANISKYFPTVDFVKDGLGVSLKTVNASSNFNFNNIMSNIDALVDARKIGSVVKNGYEVKITGVRLDIGIPKGYDASVLSGVEQYAKAKNVKVNIFEIE